MALEENLFTTKVDLFVFNSVYLSHFPEDPSFKISNEDQFSCFLQEFCSKLFLRTDRPLLSLKKHFEKTMTDKSKKNITCRPAQNLFIPRNPSQANQLFSSSDSRKVQKSSAGPFHNLQRRELRKEGNLPTFPRLADPQLSSWADLRFPTVQRRGGGSQFAVH